MLSQKSNSTLSIIWITSGHVHVINEVDQLVFTNWGKSSTGFLLKLLFQNHLKEIGISVEVEVDNLLDIFIRFSNHIIKKTFNDLSLTATSKTNQDWTVVDFNELFHQEGCRNGVDSWNGVG
jgi:hypothetical protein